VEAIRARRNWRDLAYLATGNDRQRRALVAIEVLGIFRDLAEFSPVLAGTVPLGIDLPGSDLDVLCCAADLADFKGHIGALYGALAGYRCWSGTVRGIPSVVANFTYSGWDFEVFAQPVAVEEQNGYLHLDVEARLLELGGESAREAIQELKRQGLKTEPAFARYFTLAGDPYETLARLARLEDAALRATLGRG
jgi:hypothetical protein